MVLRMTTLKVVNVCL